MINNFNKNNNKQKIRCAIYTRKSSEEGLEQEFNSLDAQRVSAQNYILSQAHEGWVALDDYYDDGGYSGGDINRPALQKLLADIRAGKVDCVVVYKIDRLSRSIVDFSQLVKIFDEHNVTFISITQSFNTRDSAGRLFLNVILCFAQYERELTGERIRDKIEASCKKGMWMGGFIPIGYDLKDRKLLINETEAKIIRTLFNTFIETTSVTDTFRRLNDLGFKTKTWIASSGKIHKGQKFNKSSVRRILENELYIGNINHKGSIYYGLHDAIIDKETWNKAQDLLENKTIKISTPNSRISQAPLLKGMMSCGICNQKMTPTYTNKKGKKYRYYICQGKHKGNNEECEVGRIPAKEAEELVTNQILNILQKPEIISQTIKSCNQSQNHENGNDGIINQVNQTTQISQNKIIESFQKISEVWDELFMPEQARIINLLVKDIIIKPQGMSINIYKEGLNSLNNEING